MREDDAGQFAAVMQGVFAIQRADLSEAVLAIWWAAMKPYDFAAVKDALNRHVVDPDLGRFLPKPADVIKLIGGSKKDAAMLGWSKVQQATLTVGAYQSVTFDDPIVNAVLADMGGWVELCRTQADAMPFKGNEFIARYQGYRMKGQIESWPAKLLGITDMTNASKGYADGDPVLIGNQQLALTVLRNGAGKALQIGKASDHLALENIKRVAA